MHIGPDQLDALQELLNIGVGHAANTLNQMLGKPIRLHIPFIHFGTVEELSKELALENEPVLASIQLPFQGSFAGSACLLFPTDSAATLVSLLTDEPDETETLDSLKEDTLTEIGNIVLNGVMGSLANVLEQPLRFSVPYYQETSVLGLIHSPAPGSHPEVYLWAQTHFDIEECNISGDILLMLGAYDLKLLIDSLCAITPTQAMMSEHVSNGQTP